MSQIKFDTRYKDRDIEVVMGWDPPLGYYHLTVFDKSPSAEDEIVYDGLGKLGFCRQLDKIKQAVVSLNIEPPPEAFELVEKREGNVVYRWNGKEWNRRDFR
jgi:hypothetical protein